MARDLGAARAWITVVLWAALVATSGCSFWSDDEAAESVAADGAGDTGSDGRPMAADAVGDSPAQRAPTAGPSKGTTRPAPAQDCQTAPNRSCCEALTPACNDCRRLAERERADFLARCLKAAVPPVHCRNAPVAVDCCTGGEKGCSDCRREALNRLLTWKATCANADQWPCDRRPESGACCQADLPSCQSCRERQRRVQASWEARCNKNVRQGP